MALLVTEIPKGRPSMGACGCLLSLYFLTSRGKKFLPSTHPAMMGLTTGPEATMPSGHGLEPWTKDKPLLILNCLPQIFCINNRKLSITGSAYIWEHSPFICLPYTWYLHDESWFLECRFILMATSDSHLIINLRKRLIYMFIIPTVLLILETYFKKYPWI